MTDLKTLPGMNLSDIHTLLHDTQRSAVEHMAAAHRNAAFVTAIRKHIENRIKAGETTGDTLLDEAIRCFGYNSDGFNAFQTLVNLFQRACPNQYMMVVCWAPETPNSVPFDVYLMQPSEHQPQVAKEESDDSEYNLVFPPYDNRHVTVLHTEPGPTLNEGLLRQRHVPSATPWTTGIAEGCIDDKTKISSKRHFLHFLFGDHEALYQMMKSLSQIVHFGRRYYTLTPKRIKDRIGEMIEVLTAKA